MLESLTRIERFEKKMTSLMGPRRPRRRSNSTSLAAFIRTATPEHGQIPPHLLRLVALLERAARTPTLALVSMPPRHGKSVTLCAALAWMVATWPDRLNAYVTYQQGFARAQSRRVRRLALRRGVRLASDAARLDDWRTEADGGLCATGISAGLTGKGFNGLVIVDDPIAGREDAESQVQRDKVYEVFNSDAFSPGGSIVVVATRGHMDDLIGRLAGLRDPTWEVINLPALGAADGAPDDDGVPLWPGRFDLDALRRIRSQIGPYAWHSLYQGQPAPKGGAVFKAEWFKHWTELPADGVWTQSWDMTFKETDDGSYVVGQVWLQKGADFYLVDQHRERLDFARTVQAILSMSARYPKAMKKLVEDKANGPAVVSMLQRDVPGLVLVQPEGGKEARANAVQGIVAAGNVFLPHPERAVYADGRRGAPWVAQALHELTVFPAGQHDDQVDALTQYLNHAAPKYAERLKQAMKNVFPGGAR
jgi:predicted phage terminase large subunit-like protein